MTLSHRAPRSWSLTALKRRLMAYNQTLAEQIAARQISALIAASVPAGPHCLVGAELCPECARRDQAATDAAIARQRAEWK